MTSSKIAPLTSRRDAIKVMALSTVALAVPSIATPSRTIPKQIIIRDSGGIFTQAYPEVLYKPFTKITGIKVISVTSGPESIPAEIRTMVETKRYMWNIAAISERAISSLTADNVYLEKHELEHDPVISMIPPQFMSPYGVGTNVYSTVLAYRADAFKGRRTPRSWKDLWDVDSFPGRRSLRKHPYDTIEAALMADGVSPANVYPCDLDRAFRSLDKIKPRVVAWWTNGPQTEQLLKSGEVKLAPVWLIRAKSAIDAGAPVAISWDQHICGYVSWVMLKGTPNADACRQFIKFASDPKRQALLASYAIGPTQPDAFKYIDPRHAKFLSTYPDNFKRGLPIDTSYWLKAQNAAIERFNDWLLS